MDSELRACAVCGRMLNHNERTGERSHIVDLLDPPDHVPVPVPPSEIPEQFRPRCDFCTAEFPTWVLPVKRIEYSGLAAGYGSVADWAACEDCAPLIQRDEWNALYRRVVALWSEKHGVGMPTEMAGATKAMYRTVRKNVSGALRPLNG